MYKRSCAKCGAHFDTPNRFARFCPTHKDYLKEVQSLVKCSECKRTCSSIKKDFMGRLIGYCPSCQEWNFVENSVELSEAYAALGESIAFEPGIIISRGEDIVLNNIHVHSNDGENSIVISPTPNAGDLISITSGVASARNHPGVIMHDMINNHAIPLAPITCHHEGDVYYSVEDDNYYCSVCKQGMGNAYYKLAKQLEAKTKPKSRLKPKPKLGERKIQRNLDEV